MHSRRVRYGGMTVSLTAALIASLVLLNIIFSTLASHFGWYVDMTPERLYSVSDTAHALIADTLKRAEEESTEPIKVEIIFAERPDAYEAGSVGSYIYNTARELELTYPDVIEISWFDCWLDKSRAEELGVKNSKNVVMRTQNGESRVFYQQEFFTFRDGDTESPVGYDGERVFATTLTSLLRGDRPLACFTVNHDEAFYDQSLVYLIRDAGYDIMLLDLYYDDIPEDCSLLLTYNPNADFIVSDGISESSELDKLTAYLATGGNYMVYISANTPVMPNFESFLAEWGITIGRSYDELTDREYNCMTKDTSAALTSDGFTILGRYAEAGQGADILTPLTERDYVPGIVFRDATALLTPEEYTTTGEATYRCGNRVRSDLFLANKNAVAWAGGKQLHVTSNALPLMTLTTDTESDARVVVCGSVEYGAEDYLQSAVFGNADALLCTLVEMGKDDVMIGLHYKPFSTSEIASITTRQMTTWTLVLTLTPAVIVLGTAIAILVRRKYS